MFLRGMHFILNEKVIRGCLRLYTCILYNVNFALRHFYYTRERVFQSTLIHQIMAIKSFKCLTIFRVPRDIASNTFYIYGEQ